MYRATDLPQYSVPLVSRVRSLRQFGVTKTIGTGSRMVHIFPIGNFSSYTHRTESTSVETVVAFKALLIRLSRTAQWHQPHWRHSTTA